MSRVNGQIFLRLFLALTVLVVAPTASFAGGLTISGTNVGIGTDTPTAPLEVTGNIMTSEGSGGMLVFPDGTTQSTATLTGPPGDQGPRGEEGPPGPEGPAGTYAANDVPSGYSVLGASATPPAGYTYTGETVGLFYLHQKN
jgi:hypothetical protein